MCIVLGNQSVSVILLLNEVALNLCLRRDRITNSVVQNLKLYFKMVVAYKKPYYV